MRAVWKGHISFGLVNVPVSLYPAEQRTDLSLHLIDSRDFSRVRYERVNAETGEEVPWDQVVKGYEYNDGNYVVIGKDELKAAAPEATQTVEVEAFVDVSEIDLLYFDKPYFLEPGKKGEKGYALLREALRETSKAAIARVVIRTRQYIAAMVPRDDVLVLNLLRYPQELRSTDELNLPGELDEVGVTKQELKMARDLVKSMTAKWDPETYHDEYRKKLMAWIDERIESGEVHAVAEPSAEEEDEPVSYNIMDALKKSLAQKSNKKSTSRKKTASSPRRKKAG
jgi:DNA end-binding protein Ku